LSGQRVRLIEVVLLLAVLALAGWLVVPAIARSRTAAAREVCLSNLQRLGQAFQNYLDDNDQRWPYVEKLANRAVHQPSWPTLPAVLSPYLGGDRAVFHCPADRRRLPDDSPLRAKFSSRTTWFDTEGLSYEYWLGEAYAGRKVGEQALSKASGFGLGRADQPLLTDFEPFHTGDEGGPFNTLNADLKARTTRARGGKP
jgi:type II secretory pathway pseudopilin PulG